MARLYGTAGSKLYIGGAMAFAGTDLTSSDFSGETWVEVKGHTSLGASGDTSELITSNRVNESRTRKLKGTRNAGSMEVVCDFDPADAGQLALVAAEASAESYAFRLVFNDAPVGGTPSERMFVGLVMGVTEELGEANNVVKRNATIEIDSNIVRVAAAEA